MKPERNCTTCRHFRRDESETQEAPDSGECRRFPPALMVIEDQPMSSFPSVDETCDCGEWKASQ